MEEILAKSVELGALGIFCLLLLTKGLNALSLLSDSQKTLATAIEKLADKINSIDGKIAILEREIQDVKADIFEIKHLLKERKNYNA